MFKIESYACFKTEIYNIFLLVLLKEVQLEFVGEWIFELITWVERKNWMRYDLIVNLKFNEFNL